MVYNGFVADTCLTSFSGLVFGMFSSPEREV